MDFSPNGFQSSGKMFHVWKVKPLEENGVKLPVRSSLSIKRFVGLVNRLNFHSTSIIETGIFNFHKLILTLSRAFFKNFCRKR